MAIACSTSAFQGIPLSKALAAVRQLGFDCVDLIAIPGWGHIEPADVAGDPARVAARVKRSLARHHLAPVTLNCAVGNLHDRSDEAREQRMAQVRGIAALMVRLGVKLASFYPGYKVDEHHWADAFAATLETWDEMRQVAVGHGVQFLIELHSDTPFGTLEQCEELIETVHDLRIAYDPSHFVAQGLDVRDTALLLERARHVHLRDAAPGKVQERFGRGSVDFGWVLHALAERGYSGSYSIECLPGADWDVTDDVTGLKRMLEERLGA